MISISLVYPSPSISQWRRPGPFTRHRQRFGPPLKTGSSADTCCRILFVTGVFNCGSCLSRWLHKIRHNGVLFHAVSLPLTPHKWLCQAANCMGQQGQAWPAFLHVRNSFRSAVCSSITLCKIGSFVVWNKTVYLLSSNCKNDSTTQASFTFDHRTTAVWSSSSFSLCRHFPIFSRKWIFLMSQLCLSLLDWAKHKSPHRFEDGKWLDHQKGGIHSRLRYRHPSVEEPPRTHHTQLASVGT